MTGSLVARHCLILQRGKGKRCILNTRILGRESFEPMGKEVVAQMMKRALKKDVGPLKHIINHKNGDWRRMHGLTFLDEEKKKGCSKTGKTTSE
jgi:hypothetical protein